MPGIQTPHDVHPSPPPAPGLHGISIGFLIFQRAYDNANRAKLLTNLMVGRPQRTRVQLKDKNIL